MDRETYIKNVKEQACQVASLLLESDDLYIDHVLNLSNLGREIYHEIWNTEFHIFGVITSETDHIPMNEMRNRCSKAFLERIDNETKELVEYYKKDVTKSCNEILFKHRCA